MATGPEELGWTAIVGAIIAVYAATLSTWQAIRYLRDERPRIRVTLGLGRILNAPGENDEKLLVNYVNVGKIPVTIPGYPALRINTHKGFKFVLNIAKYPIPQRLETYAENTAWANLDSFSANLDSARLDMGFEYWITGVVTDAAGKNHESVSYALYRRKNRQSETNIDVGASGAGLESNSAEDASGTSN